MEMKAQMERMYTHRGRGRAGSFFSGGRAAVPLGKAAGGCVFKEGGEE